MTGQPLLAFAAGLLIATVTSPVGVSGAVFLLPVQLSIRHVPNPAVTPANLLFNVIAGPGALLRHRRSGHLTGPLTRLLLPADRCPRAVSPAWPPRSASSAGSTALAGAPPLDPVLGLLSGAGGYLGARLQPHLPGTGLRLLLGTLAIALAVLYFGQAAF